MSLLRQWYDTLAKEFCRLGRRRLDNAPKLANYVATKLQRTKGCTRSIYALKNQIHGYHVFSSEFAVALRKAGYTVTPDGHCNAREIT
jgi:hypothetical protein